MTETLEPGAGIVANEKDSGLRPTGDVQARLLREALRGALYEEGYCEMTARGELLPPTRAPAPDSWVASAWAALSNPVSSPPAEGAEALSEKIAALESNALAAARAHAERVEALVRDNEMAHLMREKHLRHLRECMVKRDAAEAKVAALEGLLREAADYLGSPRGRNSELANRIDAALESPRPTVDWKAHVRALVRFGRETTAALRARPSWRTSYMAALVAAEKQLIEEGGDGSARSGDRIGETLSQSGLSATPGVAGEVAPAAPAPKGRCPDGWHPISECGTAPALFAKLTEPAPPEPETGPDPDHQPKEET